MKRVRVVLVYEKNAEDFSPDDYFDLDAARFGHITNGHWPPRTLDEMVKIDKIDAPDTDKLDTLGYDLVSSDWSIQE